jgi:DNA replicative helicase MCM subunit Mcm2 (Cdc46/Mcm family)
VSTDNNNNNNNNRNILEELKKQEEARSKAEIVDEIAYLWTNPVTRDVHFEFFDKPGIDWTTSPEAIWRKFGFISGKVSPSGNIIYLTLEDGTIRVINAVPRSWAADYKSSMEDRLKLLVLQWMRQEENNPELSLKFAEKDEMFQVKYKEMLENGKSFLAKNLRPLQVNLDSGKRGAYVGDAAAGAGLKKKKRLTVDIDATSNKPKDWTEDDHMILLQNLGHKKARTKEDFKLATSHVSPALARRIIDKGTPIAVIGIVETSADDPVQRILDARWVCRACGHEMHTHMWSYFDKPTAPSICDKCNSEEKSFAENHIVFNTMLIRVQPDLLVTTSQEALTGRIAVLLVGDEQTRLNPVGLKMVIRGHLDRIPLKNGGYEPVIIAQRVMYEEKKLELTFQDELVIRRFVGLEKLGYTTIYDHEMKWLEGDGRFTNSPDVYLNRNDVLDRLVRMVAPTHVLGYNEKLTALLTATGAPEWPGHRGRIPPLFIGPPGTDKTQFGEWILRLRPTSRKADATNMTGLSCTAMVLPDSDGNFNIHFGPFVMARYGICMIDEYEKLDPKERNRLLSGTESGFIWLDKYIHHRKIAAPTTLLATANPRDNKWEDPEAKRITSNEIQIELQQLNRFDIILPFRDIRNLEKDREFGIQKGICERREKRWKHRGDQTIVEFLAKYIEYVRNKFPMIVIPPHVDELFTEYWSQARQHEGDMLQKRNLGAIKRIAEAMARLLQVDTVDEDIARRAIKFHSETMEPFLNGIIQVRTPRDEIFYQVVDYVRNKQGQPVMVREAVIKLVDRDKRLNDYVTGGDKNRSWPLEQARNSRYDELCTALKQHPYIKVLHHKTPKSKLNAFTVAWDTAKYAEDEKIKEKREKEKSSSKVSLQSGNQKTPPSHKSDVVNPQDTVDNSEGTTHNSYNCSRTIL